MYDDENAIDAYESIISRDDDTQIFTQDEIERDYTLLLIHTKYGATRIKL